MNWKCLALCAPLLAFTAAAPRAHAYAPGSGFATNAIWPIAGASASAMQDTFGPRVQSGGVFDYHYGIDIPTPQNTVVLAILDGTVKKIAQSTSGGHTQYRVEIEHPKVGTSGTYRSTYHHLNSYDPSLCLQCPVAQGATIGRSGYDSYASFPHLHFEIRDLGGSYQKNSVHPLRVLPYSPTTLPAIAMSVNTSGAWQVEAQVTMPAAQQDLYRVEMIVLDGSGAIVAQAPWQSFYDFDLFSLTFTHTANDWNNPSCPFFSAHTGSYDAEFHLRDPDFNGVLVEPEDFNGSSTEQVLHFTFTAVTPPADPSHARILVRAWNIQGQYSEASWSTP